MNWVLCLSTILTAVMFDSPPAQAQFSGHGGPVRAIAVSADGKHLLSGSFDTAAIRVVACLRIRRAGASLSFRRGERGCLSEGWAHGERGCRCANCRLVAGPAAAGSGVRGSSRADCGTCRLARRCDAGLRFLGRHRAALAASFRCEARAGRSFAERQRRCIHAGWQIGGQRRLRPHAQDLAATGWRT